MGDQPQVKVVRVLEYSGDENWVNKTLDRSTRRQETSFGVMQEVYRSDGKVTHHVSSEFKEKRTTCAVCDRYQDDLHHLFYSIGTMRIRIGIPFCDRHGLEDLRTDMTAQVVLLEVEHDADVVL